jgi:tetratricopeptide (TPR) repeat protein
MEAAMRHFLGFFLLLMVAMVVGWASPAKAQIGKDVRIAAGSDEDKALEAIGSATDPAKKLELLEAFLTDYGKGDMAVAAYEQFVNYYLQQKNYDKAFEYGDKLFQADPDNFTNGVNMVRAAQEKGDTAKLFEYGEKVGGIVSRYKAQGPPGGVSEAEWQDRKQRALEAIGDNLAYVEQSLFSAGYRAQDASTRAGLLVRFADAFPLSSYAGRALEMAVVSYQQAQDYPKMLQVANGALAKDPNATGMLILLADYLTEKGEDLDKAESYANKAIEVLGSAKKPADLTDEQWQQQTSLQKGLALSSLGQADIWRKKNLQAIESLKAAAPLLKPNPMMYARNQYRMGFALLNLKRVAEAKAALSEAAAVDSPYKALAQDKLKSLPAGVGGHRNP